MPRAAVLWLAAGLGLAGVSGGLATAALTGSNAQVPTKTVTVDVGQGTTGPQGPPGPPGPQGPPGEPGAGGEASCPKGSTFGKLVINAPGGQVAIYTCIVD